MFTNHKMYTTTNKCLELEIDHNIKNNKEY